MILAVVSFASFLAGVAGLTVVAAQVPDRHHLHNLRPTSKPYDWQTEEHQ